MSTGSGFTPVGALNEGLWIEGCSAVVAEASQIIFFRPKPPFVTHYITHAELRVPSSGSGNQGLRFRASSSVQGLGVRLGLWAHKAGGAFR